MQRRTLAMSDPTREDLLRLLTDAEVRAAKATDGIVRCMVGGAGWAGERTLKYRSELARAVNDLDAVTRALAVLDELDGAA
jgi:hypothetical protein